MKDIKEAFSYKSEYSDKTVSENKWCVTLYNTGSKFGGHSVMLIEGVGVNSQEEETKTRFFKQIDIITRNGETISDIRLFDERNEEGYLGTHHSVSANPDKVMKMLWDI